MSRELPVLDAGVSAPMRRRLLAWFRRHQRPLPWRRTRDPYRIWVSEVMLQQTQVQTALPYYRSFLARFPTLTALARAREASVLAAWSGLGYYRRARHLREAARVVVREHAGRIPDDPVRFARLPGVGRYTTGAVLSIAFDRPLPVLDGNVARVLSRHFALDAAVRDPRGARRLWGLAESLVPMREPGNWNQALMELGARVCLPRNPQCGICPIRTSCRARSLGRQHELPPVPARRAPQPVRRAVALIERRGRFLMTRREGRLLGGLWEPPGVDLARDDDARAMLSRALAALGVRVRLAPSDIVARHLMSHRDVTIEVWRATLAAAPRPGRETRGQASRPGAGAPPGPAPRFVDISRPSVPLTTMARRLAALAGGTTPRPQHIANGRRAAPAAVNRRL